MVHAHILEEGAVQPRLENSLARKMRKINFAANAVLKTHPYPVSLLYLNGLNVRKIKMPRPYQGFIVVQGRDRQWVFPAAASPPSITQLFLMLRYPLVDHLHTSWGQPTAKNEVVQSYLHLFSIIVGVDMGRLLIFKSHVYGNSIEQ